MQSRSLLQCRQTLELSNRFENDDTLHVGIIQQSLTPERKNIDQIDLLSGGRRTVIINKRTALGI